MNMESNNVSQSLRKGPIIWQSRLTACLLQVAFYVKAQLCRSQIQNSNLFFPESQSKQILALSSIGS